MLWLTCKPSVPGVEPGAGRWPPPGPPSSPPPPPVWGASACSRRQCPPHCPSLPNHKLIIPIDQQSTLLLFLIWPTFSLYSQWIFFFTLNLSLFLKFILYSKTNKDKSPEIFQPLLLKPTAISKAPKKSAKGYRYPYLSFKKRGQGFALLGVITLYCPHLNQLLA